MVTPKADVPQALVDRDYNAVKQTINEFMTGNINANDARAKLASEAATNIADKTSDLVFKKMMDKSTFTKDFPDLSIVTDEPININYNEPNSNNFNQVKAYGATDFTVTSDKDVQAVVQNEAKLRGIADQILTVSGAYMNGKLGSSETKKELLPLFKAGEAISDNGGENNLGQAIYSESEKYGEEWSDQYGRLSLSMANSDNWNGVQYEAGKVTLTNGLTNRVETDAGYMTVGAVAGSPLFGPVGAAIGGVGGLVVSEISRHQTTQALKAGTANLFDQTFRSEFESLIN